MDERENPYAAPSAAPEPPKPKADDSDHMHPLAIAALFSIPFVAIIVGFIVYVVMGLLWYAY